ncbi:MAG: hypothetical protein KAT09_05050 [Candidatus Aegiribacteria sp.]|nr:hypothetical protein [Candidatus Aegiribacteria sp.]
MRFLITIVVCLVSVAGAVENGFPDDPAGVEIIDRAYFRDMSVLDGAVLYMRLFNDEDQGTVELFSGTPDGLVYNWELIYSWQPRFSEDAFLTFRPVCVISLQPGSNSLLITWVQILFTEYIEGMASFYLEYNLESGEISEFWTD